MLTTSICFSLSSSAIKALNQPNSVPVLSVVVFFISAVPVLPANLSPGVFALCPVPAGLSTTWTKSSFTVFPADDNFGKSGTSWRKDSSWGNFRVTTLATYGGPANLKNALVYSDNIYFAKAALKIGTQTLTNELTKQKVEYVAKIPHEIEALM